jgi:hypothetical protein
MEKSSITKTGLLGKVKLKHVWVLTTLALVYIVFRQGWPSPAFDDLVVKGTAVMIGALMGWGIDSVHFYLWKPDRADPNHENHHRRAFLIGVGMLAMALSV